MAPLALCLKKTSREPPGWEGVNPSSPLICCDNSRMLEVSCYKAAVNNPLFLQDPICTLYLEWSRAGGLTKIGKRKEVCFRSVQFLDVPLNISSGLGKKARGSFDAEGGPGPDIGLLGTMDISFIGWRVVTRILAFLLV